MLFTRPCQYKNIFGAPRTGAHSYRLFNIAIVDVILTFLGAGLIWYLTPRGSNGQYSYSYSYWKILIGFFGLGIFLHWLFCVDTTVNSFLGLV